MNKNNTLLLAGLALICISEACKRNPSKPVYEEDEYFHILFTQPYFGISKLDSAYIHWSSYAGRDSMRLPIKGNRLVANPALMPAGERVYIITLFSSLEQERRKIKWDRILTVNFKTRTRYSILAPKSFNDVNWLPLTGNSIATSLTQTKVEY